MSIPDVTTPPSSQKWRRIWGLSALGVIAVIVATIMVVTLLPHGDSNNANATEKMTKPTTSASPSPTSTSDCPAEFVQKAPDRGAAGRFIATGIKDDKEALALLGHDAPSLLAAAKAFGVEAPSDASTLVTADKSCLSRAGQDLYVGVKAIMTAKGTTVSNTAQVPDNYTNSGVSNEQVVYATEGGITGDRSATSWTWTDPSGTVHTVYVMHRCGNWPVATPPPGHPTGPTDNPKPPTPPTSPPPTNPPGTEGKVPSQDPYPQGNAPVGGGVNADPGPGVYTPPDQVTQPPAAPRENPAPPAPVVPAPQPSAPAPVPDPAPAPAPEPSAPAPSAPPSTCKPLPGETTC